MSLTKEECEKAIQTIEEGTLEIEDFNSIPIIKGNPYRYEISLLKQLIQEHFEIVKENERLQSQLLEYRRVAKQKQEFIEELQSNQPLKLEELNKGDWVWDNKNKMYVQIEEDFDEGNGNIILRYHEDSYNSNCERTEFIENRFFRKQVEDDES